MRIWTVCHFKGYVKGVYFDEFRAKEAAGPNDAVEYWEPEITPTAAKMIKELAKELK